MKRAVDNDGAAEIVDATYLVRPMAAGPTTALVLLCAVNDRARELSSISVARRSRDFMLVLGSGLEVECEVSVMMWRGYEM